MHYLRLVKYWRPPGYRWVVWLWLLAPAWAAGQGSSEYTGGMVAKLNESGTKYVRFISWGQFWARAVDNNPGTQVNGHPEETSYDFSLRRARFLMYSQISKRYLILVHFGINNQTFTTGGGSGTGGTGGYGVGKKPQLFFHDFWNEYAIVQEQADKPFSMALGAGLHYWMGLSRMTMSSTLNYLAIDAPIFNWPLIENSDQFARQMGMYLKGRAGRLEYRLHLSRPYATNNAPSVSDVAVDNNFGSNPWSGGGYLKYDFFDKEANTLPFYVGSYVGTKKVLNVGVGLYNTAQGTRSIDPADGVTQRQHPITLVALDAFADLPVGGNGMALTAYSVFYDYDFGPNYLRSIGILNEGVAVPGFTGTPSEAGAGNAQPTIGTGTIWYTQAGLLLPKFSEKVRLQPFVAYTAKNFEALEENLSNVDAGVNAYLDGHHAKLTLQYGSRPVVVNGLQDGHKGELVLQFMVFL